MRAYGGKLCGILSSASAPFSGGADDETAMERRRGCGGGHLWCFWGGGRRKGCGRGGRSEVEDGRRARTRGDVGYENTDGRAVAGSRGRGVEGSRAWHERDEGARGRGGDLTEAERARRISWRAGTKTMSCSYVDSPRCRPSSAEHRGRRLAGDAANGHPRVYEGGAHQRAQSNVGLSPGLT